ncbi:MAG: PKD domain-containing protein, partial [Bacteroidales bacterium]|nr:PKD domain-containing protein [Bacteroidales bacterium]
MKRLSIFLLLFISISCFPQGEHNNWYFGWYGALTFNSGNPVVLPQPVFFGRQHVHYPAVSDSLGNLLWTLSNGVVYDRNLNMMPNGQDMLDGPMGPSQNIGILQPGSNHIYYLFTVSNEYHGNTAGLRYSVIDMDLNGGMGDIVTGMKNLTLPYGDSCDAQLSATRHHNNKDVWFVAVRHGKPNVYLSYLLTASGLNTNPVISPSLLTKNYHNSEITYYRGYLKISRDGNHLSRSDSLMELCWFNDLNGLVTPRFIYHVNDAGTYQGSEFSKGANYLYVSQTWNNFPPPFFRLYQFDMSSPDSISFVQSRIYIGDSAMSNLQIAPDGKIYLGYELWQIEYMSVINDPSLPGASCGYTKKVIHLGTFRRHENGASDFIETYKLFIFNDDKCESDSVHFTSYIWPAADSIRWDFGDPASGSANYSTLPSPSHYYASAGNYLVSLYVRHDDNRTDTVWKTVNIHAYPTPELGDDRTICTGDSVTFDAGFCNGCEYSWSALSTGQMNVANSQTFTTNEAGIYKVDVINVKCMGSDTVQLVTTPVPQVTNTQLAKPICTGESTNIPLFGNEPGIMFHWMPTLTSGSVSGFSPDSGLIINQILTNNGATAGVVTYHITPRIGDCAGTPVDYAVTVNVGDPVDVTIATAGNTVCAGTMVTFTATPVNPGANPFYQWKVNTVNIGVNSPTFMYLPSNGDVVQCILTSSNTVCTSNNPATSNAITMVVNPVQPVSI